MINKNIMKCVTFLVIVLFATIKSVGTSNLDSLQNCSNQIEVSQSFVHAILSEHGILKSEVYALKQTLAVQHAEIDSLEMELEKVSHNILALNDSLNENVTITRKEIQASSETLTQSIARSSKAGLWISIFIVIALISIAFVFGRIVTVRKKEVKFLAMRADKLSAKADKLNEEIVNRMALEMRDIQGISKQISALSNVPGTSSDNEQKLITTLADRITFMEMTLYKMDSSVRGHKQLSKSIKQMKDNLLANGYELVEMLGKEYHEGMKVTANFIEDESLPNGQQVITGIIKPQINYKGKMIQSAQITVSQNI